MLRNANDLKNFTLGAKDGEIGRINDFYFEDQTWTIRYLIADTAKWLTGRNVLISPFAILGIRATDQVVDVDLTREQIRNSPSIDEEVPVSRQYEIKYFDYYNWPYYWQGATFWGPGPFPVLTGLPGVTPQEAEDTAKGDRHLRSMEDVDGYHLHASDGELGHIADFIIDDANWKVRYLVVDTRNWWPGKHVLVAPEWVKRVNWADARVDVDLPRELIKTAPEYDSSTDVTPGYEKKLHEHYGRAGSGQPSIAA